MPEKLVHLRNCMASLRYCYQWIRHSVEHNLHAFFVLLIGLHITVLVSSLTINNII